MTIKIHKLSVVFRSDIVGADDPEVSNVINNSDIAYGDELNAHTLTTVPALMGLFESNRSSIHPIVYSELMEQLASLPDGTFVDLEC